MTQLQEYLAEEIAIEHADGLIGRREALRRLALLGLSAAAASSLLAACASDNKQKPRKASPASIGPTVATQEITFPGPEGRTLMGAWAPAASARGGLLVVHENRGLTDHIRAVAGRFAGSGYSALAIDLLSEEGGTAKVGDANATATLAKASEARFIADMQAGVTEIAKRVGSKKLAATGFCFGGGMVWRLLDAPEARLAAAAPFYGPAPEAPDFAGAKAAVLGIYAGNDERVNAGRDKTRAALEKASLTHELVTYPNVGHAFFREGGPNYNAEAATQAYAKVLDWFGKYVG